MKRIKHVSDATFDKDVLQVGQPGAGRFLGGMVRPLQDVRAGARRDRQGIRRARSPIAKLDIDANPSTPGKYGIRGIPTVILYKGGQAARAEGRRAHQVAADRISRQQPVRAERPSGRLVDSRRFPVTLPCRKRGVQAAIDAPPHLQVVPESPGAAGIPRGAPIPNPSLLSPYGRDTAAFAPFRHALLQRHASIRTQIQTRIRTHRGR